MDRAGTLHSSGTDLQHFLSSLSLFHAVDENLLVSFTKALKSLNMEKGNRLFSQGDTADSFYLLRQGFMKILRESESGRSTLFELLGPGELVGVVAVVNGRPFPASAETAVSCEVLSMPGSRFLGFLNEHARLAENYAQVMSRRLLKTREMQGQTMASVESRIARLMVELGERIGRKDGTSVRMPRMFTRQEIADMAGTTVESTIRTFSKWKQVQMIKEEDKTVIFSVENFKDLI
jgi:CRP/FNR family transcriptional regulator